MTKLPPPYLVQVRDHDGFWCNVWDGDTLDHAVSAAEWLVIEQAQTHRVVAGPARTIYRVIAPTGDKS